MLINFKYILQNQRTKKILPFSLLFYPIKIVNKYTNYEINRINAIEN